MVRRHDEERRSVPGDLGPGDFKGHAPRYGADQVARAARDSLEGRWFATSRYQRRARVTRVEDLTSTGTVRVAFRVVDGQPFRFSPGQFVGIEGQFEGFGYRRSPYCILSAPSEEPVFELLVRMVDDGPLSLYLGGLEVGDEVAFRGPTGRTMLPREGDPAELVLLATGTGIAPFYALGRHLVDRGYRGPIRLWWGLRQHEDICLVPELDQLAAGSSNFSYGISLSEPPAGWTGLAGRLTATVPPLLGGLGDKRFYLAGNGAMIEEVAMALSDLGVLDNLVYKEPFFNTRYRPAPASVAAVRSRFGVPYRGDRRGGSRPGKPGPARPGPGPRPSVSEIYESMPAYISREDLDDRVAVGPGQVSASGR